MAYRIKPDKSFTSSVRAVADEQLTRAIDVLERRPEGLHEAVHAARKNFKRVRALYRLAAGANRDFRQRENICIRDMARGLAAVRDATALIEVVAYLQDCSASDNEKAVLSRVHDRLVTRRDDIAAKETDLEDKTRQAIETCEQAREALDGLTFADDERKTARLLRKTWRKTVNRAARALAACQNSAGEDLFHELRKRSQDYWMSLSLLRDIWPSAIGAKREQANHLVKLLGHEHDLSVLVALADESPDTFGSTEDLAWLLSAVITRQRALREEAIKQAQLVFEDDPDEEARVIEILWRHAADQ